MGTRVSAPFSVVAIHDGEKGDKGDKGDDGRGGDWTEIRFSLSSIGAIIGGSSSDHPQDCTQWSPSLPSPTSEKPYVWMRSIPQTWNDSIQDYVAGDATYTCITGAKGSDGDTSLVASLDDDMTMVICDGDGTPPSGWTWTTIASLYYGVNPDAITSATATINGRTTNKATIVIANNRQSATLTVKNLTASDSDVIKVVVTLTSLNGTRACTATVTKSRKSEVYQLRPSFNVIKVDKDGVRTPTVFLEVGAVKISDGTVSNLVMIGSGVKVMAKYSKDGGTTWSNCSRQIVGGAILDNYGVPLTGNETSLRLRLIDNADGGIYDEEDIPVISDGLKGDTGPQGYEGLILRVSEWEVGKYYRNDEDVYDENMLSDDGHRYLDIVSVTEGGSAVWYNAKATHNGVISSDGNNGNRPGISTAWRYYWSEFEIQGAPIMTPLLYAQRALIEYLQTNQILLLNPSLDKVMGGIGYADGNVSGDMVYPLWLGGETALDPNTNFYVDINGRMFCVGADIQGNVTIKGEDGVVVYDTNNNERVRMSTRNVTKPKEDKEYPLWERRGLNLYNVGQNATIWADTPLERRDGEIGFQLGVGQSVGGSFVITMKSASGAYGRILSDGVTLSVKLTLRTSTKVLAESTNDYELYRDDVFENLSLFDIQYTNVGKYVSNSDEYCYLYVEMALKNISASNFTLYGRSDSTIELGVANFFVNVAYTKTTIAPNGFCVNAGGNRHALMDNDGILFRWGNHGLRIDDSGVKKLVNGTWVDI